MTIFPTEILVNKKNRRRHSVLNHKEISIEKIAYFQQQKNAGEV